MHRLVSRRPSAGLLAVLAATALLSGCAASGGALTAPGQGLLGRLTPYRIEVVQGNVLTREQVALVQPGMTRAQVRDILGSPLLTDVFHADRWDYIFTIQRAGAAAQRRSVVVFFDGERLQRLEAPDLPSEQEFVTAISTARPRGAVPVLELTPEQRRALPAPKAAATAAQPPQLPAGPVREYPPLER